MSFGYISVLSDVMFLDIISSCSKHPDGSIISWLTVFLLSDSFQYL
jgi:hypothetical protein